ncbi:histidine kinase dimerization/phosphoacceptor domain -containing protein [Lutibacter sp.]
MSYFKYIITIFFLFSTISSLSNEIDSLSQKKIVDSIISSIHFSKYSDSLKIIKLNRFASKKRYEKYTIKLIKEAEKIAIRSKNLKFQADTYCSLGNFYFYNSKLDLAEASLLKAEKLAKTQKIPFIKAAIKNTLSGIYRKKGNISLAIKTLLNSKKILENIDTLTLNESLNKRVKGEKIILNNTLANFYNQIEETQKAVTFYNEAYRAAIALNSSFIAGVILSNKGDLLLNEGKYNEALKLLLKGKALKIKGNAPLSSIANSNQNIGAALLKLKKYNEALNNLNKALNYYLKNNLPTGLMQTYIERGHLYFLKGELSMAKIDCEKAKVLAVKYATLESQKNACLCLSKTYEALGDNKNSLINYKLYQVAKDSIFNERNFKKITQLEMQYKYDKEKELQEFFTKTREKENKTTIRNLVVSILTLVLILGLVYRLYYIRHKSNNQLKLKNIEISNALAINETLFKETHHRVKNNLQIISSLLNMQSHFLDDDKSKAIVTESKNRINSMSLIHQKLYQENSITGIETSSYFTELIDSLCHSYGVNRNNVKINVSIENILLDIDTAIPLGLILNEIISNAFKYGISNKTGVFSLSFFKQNKRELILVIKDNGPGIPNNFNWEESKSYGMKLIQTLSKKLKATLKFKNNNGLEIIMKIHKFNLAKNTK